MSWASRTPRRARATRLNRSQPTRLRNQPVRRHPHTHTYSPPCSLADETLLPAVPADEPTSFSKARRAQAIAAASATLKADSLRAAASDRGLNRQQHVRALLDGTHKKLVDARYAVSKESSNTTLQRLRKRATDEFVELLCIWNASVASMEESGDAPDGFIFHKFDVHTLSASAITPLVPLEGAVPEGKLPFLVMTEHVRLRDMQSRCLEALILNGEDVVHLPVVCRHIQQHVQGLIDSQVRRKLGAGGLFLAYRVYVRNDKILRAHNAAFKPRACKPKPEVGSEITPDVDEPVLPTAADNSAFDERREDAPVDMSHEDEPVLSTAADKSALNEHPEESNVDMSDEEGSESDSDNSGSDSDSDADLCSDLRS